jgi:hypothetical protein
VKLDRAEDTFAREYLFQTKVGARYYFALDSIFGRGELRLRGDFSTLHLTGLTNHQAIDQRQPQIFQISDPDPQVDGSIQGVSYFARESYDVALGSSTTPPFIITCTNLSSGNILVFALATNALGTVTFVAPVHLEVTPRNDAFTNADVISGYEFYIEGTTANATAERGERLHGGARNSRWWSWTAPASGRVTLSGVVKHATYGIAIYTGDEMRNLTRVRERREATSLSFDAVGGTTYRIAIACRKARSSIRFYALGTLRTLDIISPANGSSFTDIETVPLAIKTTEKAEDIERVEYLVNQTVIALATNAPFASVWTNALPGNHCITARAIRRDGLTPVPSEVCTTILPANDFFTNATVVLTNYAVLTGWFYVATAEAGEPALHSNYNHTVWWSWTAPTDGVLVIAPAAPSPSTIFGAFVGNSIKALTLVATGRLSSPFDPTGGRFRLMVTNGVRYHISAASSRDANATFRLQFYARPANDSFAERSPIIGNSNLLHAQFVGATSEPNEPATEFSQTNTLWWTWTAPTPGAVSITAVQPEFNPLAVYWSNSLTSLIPVQDLRVVSGETLQLRVWNNSWSTETADIQFLFEPVADNDAFALRYPIIGTNEILYGDSAAATLEPDEPAHASYGVARSLWWTWSAPSNGDVRVNSLDGFAAFAIYEGASLGTLTRITTGVASSVFRALAGHSYHFAVDVGNFHSRPGTWQLAFFAASSNDDFQQATLISSASVQIPLTMAGASRESGEPSFGPADQRSVWFRWTATNTALMLAACADALVGVFVGEKIDQLTPIGSRNYDDAALFNAIATSNYWIRVAGPSNYLFDVASRDFIVKAFTPPANDLFAAAERLTNNVGHVSIDNWGATTENGELTNRFSVRRTLWYRWIAPSSGWLTLRNTNLFDSISFRLFTGTNIGGLFDVYSVSSYLRLPVWAGEDYRLQVDRENGAGGSISFDYLFEPAPANDEFENAFLLTTLPALLEGNTVTATTEGQPYYTASRFVDRDLWWRWIAPSNGVAILTNLTDVANLVRVFTGTTRGNRVLIATNWPAALYQPFLSFNASAGTAYSILVSGRYTNDAVKWQLSFPAGGTPASFASAKGSGEVQVSFVIEFSTNLVNWIPVETNHYSRYLQDFIHSAPKDFSSGFYRERRNK